MFNQMPDVLQVSRCGNTTWQTRELWHRNEISVTQVSCPEVLCRNNVQKICSSRWGFLSTQLSILQEGKQDHELINLSVCPCVPHLYHWNCVTLIQISQITWPPVATSCMNVMPPEPSLVSHGGKNKTDARTRKMAAMLTTQYWVQKWCTLTDLRNICDFLTAFFFGRT